MCGCSSAYARPQPPIARRLIRRLAGRMVRSIELPVSEGSSNSRHPMRELGCGTWTPGSFIRGCSFSWRLSSWLEWF